MPKLFKPFLFAFVGYYLMGRFGLSLAIPPGFASAVWPASGLALACMLLWRNGITAIGIALGSFLINLGVASNNFSDLQINTFLPAVGIACGAVVQAWWGWRLWLHFLSENSLLDSPRDILLFILLVAPVGCLVAASIGPGILFFLGIVSIENLAFTWFTWWIGDTIGVLLFTPLLLLLLKKNLLTWNRKFQIALPTLILFFAVLTLFFYSTKARKHAIENELEEKGRIFSMQIEERLLASVTRITSFHAFFASERHYDKQRFEAYASTIVQQDSILRAIGWTEIHTHFQRHLTEEQFRSQGNPEFSYTEFSENRELVPAQRRTKYFPVLHITPYEGNEVALGLDLGANPARLQALETALKTGKPVSTEPIKLAQETENSKAFILYLPIFNHNSRMEAAKNPERSKNHNEELLGYVSAVYDVDTLLGPVLLTARKQHFNVEISDNTDANNVISLISNDATPLKQNQAITFPLTFGGRHLQIEIEPDKRFQVSTKDWASWTLLTIGFFVIAMLQALLLMLTGTTERIREQVKVKTADYLKAMQEAEIANEAKSAFLANMSHEFRTPLNAIIGFNTLALKTKLNSIQRDYMHKAQLASETLLALISHILDFSKLDAGKLVIEKHDFDFSELIRKIEAIFSIQAKNKNLSFNIEIGEALPRYIHCDSLRIEQILLNLCNNALKFTEFGGVALTCQKQGSSLVFTVADTGIGISQKKQSQLFQPFQQADNSVTRRFGGTGLGLAICRQICEQLGGHIDLNSEEGHGSVFTVSLPLTSIGNEIIDNTKLKSAFGNATNAEIKINLQESENKLKNMHVLVVEDTALNRDLIEYMLEDYGVAVSLAEDGEKALEYFSSNQHFDVVLMDINMPNMDGYEATRAIRQLPAYRSIPIIAMTANVGNEDIQRCLAAGMNAHLAKPLSEKSLLQILSRFQPN